MSQRVTFGREVLATVVKAQNRFICDGHLAEVAHTIEPGQQYVASALPPNSEIGNTGWWHHRLCMDCCPIEFAGGAS